MCKQKSQHCSRDHSNEHESGHIVSWLHHKPHRQHRCKEDVDECDVYPHFFPKYHREVHTKYKCQYSTYQSEYHFFPSGKVYFMLYHTEYHREQNKEQRNTSCRTVYSSIFSKCLYAVCHYICVKCISHHICKRGDNDQTEQPAEPEEQLTSCFSDIFLYQKSHGFAVVLHTCIQRPEICDSTEEDTSKDDPQKYRQPSECSGLYCSGDRSCTCY